MTQGRLTSLPSATVTFGIGSANIGGSESAATHKNVPSVMRFVSTRSITIINLRLSISESSGSEPQSIDYWYSDYWLFQESFCPLYFWTFYFIFIFGKSVTHSRNWTLFVARSKFSAKFDILHFVMRIRAVARVARNIIDRRATVNNNAINYSSSHRYSGIRKYYCRCR